MPSKLPSAYNWLASEPGPRVLVEALSLFGTLTGALEEASTQVRSLREENGGLKNDIASLRREVRAMLRMCTSMRAAMQRAVDTGDCSPLRLWLELNPVDTDDVRPAA